AARDGCSDLGASRRWNQSSSRRHGRGDAGVGRRRWTGVGQVHGVVDLSINAFHKLARAANVPGRCDGADGDVSIALLSEVLGNVAVVARRGIVISARGGHKNVERL